MKPQIGILLSISLLFSCGTETSGDKSKPNTLPIQGTWQLISGTLIEKGDTLITDYTKGVSFIKIINETHFAFLQHDLKQGKDSASVFSAGGGRYSLQDNIYTERLEYCSAREWEGNDFKFTIMVDEENFIQSGIEKIESAGIDRINIEKYRRVKN